MGKSRCKKTMGKRIRQIFCFTGFCIGIGISLAFAKTANAAVTEVDLANPVMDKDTHYKNGPVDTSHITKFSYIYFGSYPQKEIRDEYLTDAIKNAPYDENGDAVVNGKKYRRLTWEMKTSTGTLNEGYKEDWDKYSYDGYRYFQYEPIRWRILQNRGNSLFLHSAEIIDQQQMYGHDKHLQFTRNWETYELREWLNYDGTGEWKLKDCNYKFKGFLPFAFTKEEQDRILVTDVKQDNNPQSNTSGGNDTEDKIFVPSVTELTTEAYGFCNVKSLKNCLLTVPTHYAEALGNLDTVENRVTGEPIIQHGCYSYWLRTKGKNQSMVTIVNIESGRINLDGSLCGLFDGVAPAMNVSFQYADCIKVMFETNGAEAIDHQILLGSGCAKEPAIPKKEGYQFAGWYFDKDCKEEYLFNQPITKDTTLYAGWKQNKKVNFVTNGGSAVTEQMVMQGEVVKKPEDPKKEKYIFTGWYTDAACKNAYDFNQKVENDFTLYAGWKAEEEIIVEEVDGVKVTKQAPPKNLVGGVLEIIGTTSAMEYKKDQSAEGDWVSCEEGSTKVPSEGTYYVRYKRTPELLESDSSIVKVNKDVKQMIQSTGGEKDVKGSTFRSLQARVDKTTSKTIRLKWKKIKGADGYQIYGSPCGKKKFQCIKKIRSQKKTCYTQKKRKKGTYYKYIVVAYKEVNGKEVALTISKTIHATTTGGRYGNAKSVKVNKKSVVLKKNKTYRLKAKEIRKNKKIKKHRSMKFESSNKAIATVSKKGVIKGKKKGSCTIYVYAQNGMYQKVKVRVK